jgi:hypothetical protein
MDQTPLVARQIEDGAKLVEELARSGYPLQGAFWARKNDSDRWDLYFISPLLESEHPIEAYRQFSPVVRRMQPMAVGLFDVQLIRPSDPVARDVLKLIRVLPWKLPGHFPGSQLGWHDIDQGYVYAPVELPAFADGTK